MVFQYANVPPEDQTDVSTHLPSPYTLKARPVTDIWKKPPAHDVFDAPLCYQTLKLSTFRSARVRVSGPWKTLFDQGGLCLVLPSAPSGETGNTSSTNKTTTRKWVKAGIEFFNQRPNVSAVACDRWADWGLVPLSGNAATIEMEREVTEGQLTSTLWIYIVEADTRTPVREITWVFEPQNLETECWIGVYAAKPTPDKEDSEAPIKVSFHDFEVRAA